MRKYIRINADDFGMSESINFAIYDLYIKNKINSTSLIVEYEYDYNSELDNPLKNAVDIVIKQTDIPTGLHVILPIVKNASFVSEELKAISLKEMEIAISCEVLEYNMAVISILELIEKQYSKFIEIVGKKPTHIDFHKNTNFTYKFVSDALELFINKYGYITHRTRENSCELYFMTIDNITKDLSELYVHPSINQDIFNAVHSKYQYNRYIEYIYLLNTNMCDTIEKLIDIKELNSINKS